MNAIGILNRLSALLIIAVISMLGAFGYLSLRVSVENAHRLQRAELQFEAYRSMSADLNDEYAHDLQSWVGPSTSTRERPAAGGFAAALKRAEHNASSAAERSVLLSIGDAHRRYAAGNARFVRMLAGGLAPDAQLAQRNSLQRIFVKMEGELSPPYRMQFARAQALAADERRAQNRLETCMAVIGLAGALVLLLLLYTAQIYKRRADNALRGEMKRLEQAALTDSLTGLGNHRAFYDQFEREVSRARRHGSPLTLALLDVDDFKSLNDTRGHKHGDEVLLALGSALCAARLEDAAYRLGGDEFALMLVETGAREAEAAIRNLRQRIEAALAPVTVSIGVCTMTDNHDHHDLYEQADAALYAAKSRGRNDVAFFQDIQLEAVVFSNRKASALRALLESKRIDVAFQPIWSLAQSHIFGLEALARPAPDSGLAGPQEAFDIAERIRRTAELDVLCVSSVFGAAATLPENVFLFVNVAPDSLSHPALSPDRWLERIRTANLRPSQIVIELTERRIAKPDHVLRMLAALRACGISIALDDTGSGYAGLNLLTQTAFDFVKVDRSIVAAAEKSPRTRAVLAGIIAIARESGSFVIAEGIEKVEQLAFLRRLQEERQDRCFGVHGAQGYLLGCPKIGEPRIETFLQYAPLLGQSAVQTLLEAV